MTTIPVPVQDEGRHPVPADHLEQVVAEIREMGYSPLALRYALLSVPYRTKLNFTQQSLDDAQIASRRRFFASSSSSSSSSSSWLRSFSEYAMAAPAGAYMLTGAA